MELDSENSEINKEKKRNNRKKSTAQPRNFRRLTKRMVTNIQLFWKQMERKEKNKEYFKRRRKRQTPNTVADISLKE